MYMHIVHLFYVRVAALIKRCAKKAFTSQTYGRSRKFTHKNVYQFPPFSAALTPKAVSRSASIIIVSIVKEIKWIKGSFFFLFFFSLKISSTTSGSQPPRARSTT